MHHTPPLPVETILHLDNMFINTNKKEIIKKKKKSRATRPIIEMQDTFAASQINKGEDQ
jgi:hypothetical protein